MGCAKDTGGYIDSCQTKLDINEHVQDKFVHALWRNTGKPVCVIGIECDLFKKFKAQSDYSVGLILCGDQVLPKYNDSWGSVVKDIAELHHLIKQSGVLIFWGARVPVESHRHIIAWKYLLADYWDQQLLQLLESGFPVEFNQECPLQHELKNHKPALECLNDVAGYLYEEL